jgi:hypothetical protein
MSHYAISALLVCAVFPPALAQGADPTISTPLIDKRFTYPDQIVRILSGVHEIITDRGKYSPTKLTQTLASAALSSAIINVTRPLKAPILYAKPPWSILSTVRIAYIHPHLPSNRHSVPDFCLWGPPEPNSVIGDTEGGAVAWCTKPGRGTRLIPANALTGVQFMRTPDYLQVVGFIDQTLINIQRGDSGGELDPHGADLASSSSVDASSAWATDFGHSVVIPSVASYIRMDSPATTVATVPTNRLSNGISRHSQFTRTSRRLTRLHFPLHSFMGGGAFCIKACDPAGNNAANFCQHKFDRIGCKYNAPNNAQNNVFQSCQGDNQDFPGVYTEEGQVMTYTQPSESLGDIQSVPYEPRTPASSNCQTFSSSQLYTATGTASGSGATSGPGGSLGSAATNSRGGASASPSQTGGGVRRYVPRGASIASVIGTMVLLIA